MGDCSVDWATEAKYKHTKYLFIPGGAIAIRHCSHFLTNTNKIKYFYINKDLSLLVNPVKRNEKQNWFSRINNTLRNTRTHPARSTIASKINQITSNVEMPFMNILYQRHNGISFTYVFVRAFKVQTEKKNTVLNENEGLSKLYRSSTEAVWFVARRRRTGSLLNPELSVVGVGTRRSVAHTCGATVVQYDREAQTALPWYR